MTLYFSMKHFLGKIVVLAAAFIAVSCVGGLVQTDDSGLHEVSFTATFGQETKASLGEGLSPCWEAGESVSVYDPIAQTSRIFTVSSVNGPSAVITGTISTGDFPISAVYPASAAGQWKGVADCAVNIPRAQTIPSDRNIDPAALVSEAYSESSSTTLVFRNSVSLLKFRSGHEGVDEVSFSLRKDGSSAEYSVRSSSSFNTEEWYYVAVAPDNYGSGASVKSTTASGECYTLSSESALNAERSGLLSLGVLSGGEKSVAYNIQSEGRFTNFANYMNTAPVFRDLTDESKMLLQLLTLIYLPWSNDPVKTVVFTHRSTGPSGDPVTLSAILYVPETAITNGRTLNGVVIANHASITSDAERPSLVHDAQSIAAWKGYAVVISDYCGFGADAEHSQAYLNPEAAAEGTFDAYRAACQILKDSGVKYGSSLYNIGYSQGAFNGMANIKYLSEHPELGLKFKKSFLGGGPYDIRKTWQDYLDGSYPKAKPFAPLTVSSFIECGSLDLTYDRVFKGALLNNYNNWIVSKKYTLSQITAYLRQYSLSDMLTRDVMTSGTAVNDMIMGVCDRFTLVKGWKPASGNVIRIYHSTQDDIVPYSNFSSIKAFLDENATDCTVSYKSGENGDHINAVVAWAADMVMNW